MDYDSHVHTVLLNRTESKVFRLSSPPPIDCLQFLKHRSNVASLSTFYRYFQGYCSSELANCMHAPLPRPRYTRLLLSLIPVLSTSLIEELTIIHILSSLSLVNSRTLCLILLFHLPTPWPLLREKYQDACVTKLIFFFF